MDVWDVDCPARFIRHVGGITGDASMVLCEEEKWTRGDRMARASYK